VATPATRVRCVGAVVVHGMPTRRLGRPRLRSRPPCRRTKGVRARIRNTSPSRDRPTAPRCSSRTASAATVDVAPRGAPLRGHPSRRLFDHVGAGGSDASEYSRERYGSLAATPRRPRPVRGARPARRRLRRPLGQRDDRGLAATPTRPASRRSSSSARRRATSTRRLPGRFTREDIEGSSRPWTPTTSAGRARWPRDHGQRGAPELGEELAASFCRADRRSPATSPA
jgi:hypothetical protein